jgi:chromosome segregation ATPase
VGSADLSREIEELEHELSGLRTRVDEDNSSFSALEQQIDQLRHRLTETRDAVRSREQALTDKKAALADVQRVERLEAYDTYDGEVLGLRKLLEEMRDAFGEDERVTAVQSTLNEEAQQLEGTWQAVVGATTWRLDEIPAQEAEVADESAEKDGEALSKDLQRRAEEGRAARILDYFKS